MNSHPRILFLTLCVGRHTLFMIVLQNSGFIGWSQSLPKRTPVWRWNKKTAVLDLRLSLSHFMIAAKVELFPQSDHHNHFQSTPSCFIIRRLSIPLASPRWFVIWRSIKSCPFFSLILFDYVKDHFFF